MALDLDYNNIGFSGNICDDSTGNVSKDVHSDRRIEQGLETMGMSTRTRTSMPEFSSVIISGRGQVDTGRMNGFLQDDAFHNDSMMSKGTKGRYKAPSALDGPAAQALAFKLQTM